MFSLGLSGGGGNYIRFSPSINAWQLGKDELDLKKIVFDLDSIKTGWGMMAEGQAPQWVWDEKLGQRSMKPEGEFKRGFSVRCWLGPDRGWAEWSSTGTGPCMGFEALAGEAMAQAADNPGKVVLCAYKGSTATKVGKGNTRVPQFEIVGWVDRPADDGDEDEAPAPAPSRQHPQQMTPPSTGSKAVPPPAAKKAAAVDLSDFG
jgi:hypothetical protein